MKAANYLFFLLLLLAPAAFGATRNLLVQESAGQQKRVALVIGNSSYQSVPQLKNPVNDARAMAGTLNKLGFRVIEVTDASQREMNLAIADFGQQLNKHTVALFFYAGHGMQVKGKNYLVPVDAEIDREAAVRAEAVDVDAVLDQLSASSVGIVILDACRNNPFERSFRSMGGGLAQMDAPMGSFIAYATAPGKIASDGSGKNGLFTQELLKQINTPGLPLEEVFKRVRANVARVTGNEQIPWDSSSMTGDFYFKPGKPATGQAQPPIHVESAEEIEQEFWDQIKDSSNSADFASYLKQYPEGRFTVLARAHLRALSAPTPENAAAAPATPDTNTEVAYWNAVKNTNSPGELQAYLDKFPQGVFSELARSRLQALQPVRPEPDKAVVVLMTNVDHADLVWRYSLPGMNADVQPGSYRVLELAPGEYTFDLSAKVESDPPEFNHRGRKTLLLTAGKITYLRVDYDGLFGNKIVELPADDGARIIHSLKRSAN